MKSRFNFFSLIHFIVLILSLTTDWYYPLVFILFISVVILMLDKLGKGVVLRETIALHTCFVCLVMPVVSYTFFDKTNRLARIFVKYMQVPASTYFDFALPAIAGFILILCWPIETSAYSDKGSYLQQAIAKAKAILERRPLVGVYLLAIGTVMFWVSKFLPATLEFAFLLFFFAAFAGFLYVFYQTTFRYRRIILFFFGAFIITTALSTGMFTIVAYMSLTLFSFFFLGRKTPLWKKFYMFLLGVLILLLIQSVKPTYRALTWDKHYEGSNIALFANLLVDKVTEGNWSSPDAFFLIYIRTNQGFNVSLVMRRIPSKMPYDGGSNLLLSVASSLVPRLLWPDKPEAGGKYNMQYYTGVILHGWSTNIGPLGEAYGSFGASGGIIYMCFLALFVRWAYLCVFKVSVKLPLIIFWIPVLFYQVTYAAETDTLQVFNSLIKSAFFIWMLYKQWPHWFGVERRRTPLPRLQDKGGYSLTNQATH